MNQTKSSSSSGFRRESFNPFADVLHNSQDDEIPLVDNLSTFEASPQKENGGHYDDDNSQASNSSSGDNCRMRPPRPSMAVVAASKSIGAMNQRRRRRSSARFLHLSGGSPGNEKNDEEMTHNEDQVPASSETRGTLQEMYQTAIRMNAENKINTTNTWNLHIIDQMDTLLSLNDEAENGDSSERSISFAKDKTAQKQRVNFTKASCTLDASVKIYSFRVDDVHLTSYKVLANLNRTQNNKSEDTLRSTKNSQDPIGDDGEDATEKASHPGKGSTANTLESNMANINLNKLDSAFDIDPLFHKMSKTFDEGGAKGLLLANLGVSESSCHIVFDSSATGVADESLTGLSPVDVTNGGPALHRIPEGSMDVATLIAKLSSLLSEFRVDDDWDLDSNPTGSIDLHCIPLIPQLSALRAEHEKLVAAGCCGPDAAIALAPTIGPKTPAGKVRHYHPDAQQEQDADYSIHQEAIERSQRKMNISSDMKFSPATALFRNRWSNDRSNEEGASPSKNLSMDDYGDGGFIHDDGNDDDDDHCFDTFIANARYSDVSLPNSAGQAASDANLSLANHQSSTIAGFIDNIAAGVTLLSGNDYEYFTSSNVPNGGNHNVWAGASHWKRNGSNIPKSSKETVPKKTTKSKSRKVVKRKTKEEPLVDFAYNSNPDLSFLWKDSSKRKGSATSTHLSKAMITKYTDEENILPIDLGFQSCGDFSSLQQLTTLILRPKISILQSLNRSRSNIMLNEDTFEIKKTVEFQLPTSIDSFNDHEDNDGRGFDFGADEDDEFLVPELENVRKIKKVRVGYATVAKKVDVKRLKRDLWQELEYRFGQVSTTSIGTTMENMQHSNIDESHRIGNDDADVTLAPDASNKGGTAETVISFHDAVRSLGKQQPQGDITLPFYFICILHLANEKGLRLEQGECSFSNDIDRIEEHQSLLSDFLIHQQ